ncbi:glycoside hydrolase family 3 protein [Actinoplanes derwentensis]|uniref:beta-N-acetylhexosaminidase n=1 Tax=Actinoplanes derwentensis TaxID=113562 RepID=A0A1H1YRT2_9ACTN|nr:glycoside hydrolase family 3 protein [Actinoplanes derwentensis]GID81259.1 beta-N-acetylhexosaminidase [Actinoplanes derwentensis]SDT24042.1 beta-N-acetylhexosaminidase [Actinoplanes derwentensis]
MRTRTVAFLAVAALGIGLPTPAVAKPHPINALIARMTLPEKVGQLFTTYVHGTAATTPSSDNKRLYGVDTPAEVVAKYHLGGVVYFSWTNSLQNPRQITTLSNGLQAASKKVPLMISTDQEHGVVTRMPAPATRFPGAMALGAGRDPAGAYRTGQVTGVELRAVGIRQAWAPVADVNVNPANPVIGVRSFSSDPTLTGTLAANQIRGLQQGAGISASAKHFPGHGDTATDSHTGLPVINHTRAQWQRIDAPPFRAAIAAGVDTIMSAHIVVPALDPTGDPATLSNPIITGLLRGEFGYRGVIVTDSLEMQGVREKYGDARVPVLALKAGIDVLLMPPNLDVAYRAVLKAVADGELTESRIDESVRRILTLKQKRGLLRWTPADPAAAQRIVGSAAHRRTAQSVTDRTVTVIRNDARLLPLATKGKRILVTGWTSSTYDTIGVLARELTATALPTTVPDQAAAAAREHDLTVVLSNNGQQQALLAALLKTGKPIVVVAVRNPYDLTALPGVTTYLATYSYTDVSMRALAKVLTGVTPPRGRLPVAIPGLYPYGHGLSWGVK